MVLEQNNSKPEAQNERADARSSLSLEGIGTQATPPSKPEVEQTGKDIKTLGFPDMKINDDSHSQTNLSGDKSKANTEKKDEHPHNSEQKKDDQPKGEHTKGDQPKSGNTDGKAGTAAGQGSDRPGTTNGGHDGAVGLRPDVKPPAQQDKTEGPQSPKKPDKPAAAPGPDQSNDVKDGAQSSAKTAGETGADKPKQPFSPQEQSMMSAKEEILDSKQPGEVPAGLITKGQLTADQLKLANDSPSRQIERMGHLLDPKNPLSARNGEIASKFLNGSNEIRQELIDAAGGKSAMRLTSPEQRETIARLSQSHDARQAAAQIYRKTLRPGD